MPRFSTIQTNFTAGEFSPKLKGRVDISRYQNAAEIMENACPLVFGGARRSHGSVYAASAKHHDKKAVLIPFIFSRTQAYILEFGDLYMRVYKDGGQVETSPGVPYEIATPYTEAMLPDIRAGYTQGADTMFLFCDSKTPHRLRRFDHASWDLSPAPILVEPFDEVGSQPAAGLTLSSAAVGTGRTVTASAAVFMASDVGREITLGAGLAVITAYTDTQHVTAEIKIAFASTSLASGDWTLEGSPQTDCTPSAKDPVGTAITLTLTAEGWRAGDVGKYVRINGGLCKIESLDGTNPATVANAVIKKALTSDVASPALAWSIESTVWSDSNGYPRTGTLYEQRLLAAGTKRYPQTVFGSRIAEYLDFTKGVDDDEAFAFKLASDQVNPIIHLSPVNVLVALTYGGETTIQGGVEKPITPTNVQAKNRTIYGCNNVRPARVGNELLFVQRSGKRVRAMGYRFDSDSYAAGDVSLLAEHITAPGIVDMAYQQEPDGVLWAVRADGVLATLTLDREQDVIGWARRTTDGEYEAVASIPTAAGDEVWVIVKRTINGQTKRYVERFVEGMNTDCAITGTSGPGATTWTGLGHLEGKTVDILADGVVMPQQVVTNGEINLPRNAHAVEIGLHYETTIKMLPIESQVNGGTLQGKNIRVGEVIVRFYESIGCTIEGSEGQTETLPFRKFGVGVLDKPVPPFTGDKSATNLGWEVSGGSITIKQTQPLPLHVLAVVRRVTVND